MLLGVNIDHIAVLREARKVADPDPLDALGICKRAGADQITIHLREDRRHMQDMDAKNIIELSSLPVNLECAISPEMIDIACSLRPHRVTLVPEKREELTTEGGLDVVGQLDKITQAVAKLSAKGIETSLFIDADKAQIDATVSTKATYIEIHTGHYAEAQTEAEQEKELARIQEAVSYATKLGLKVNAGHGLHYHNVKPIAAMTDIIELNIGHAIIARAAIDGLDKAVSDMKRLMLEARQ